MLEKVTLATAILLASAGISSAQSSPEQISQLNTCIGRGGLTGSFSVRNGEGFIFSSGTLSGDLQITGDTTAMTYLSMFPEGD